MNTDIKTDTNVAEAWKRVATRQSENLDRADTHLGELEKKLKEARKALGHVPVNEDDAEHKLAIGCLDLTFSFLLLPVGLLSYGYVLQSGLSWFWPGGLELPLGQVIGIVLIARLLMFRAGHTKDSTSGTAHNLTVLTIVWFLYGLMYLTHMYL